MRHAAKHAGARWEVLEDADAQPKVDQGFPRAGAVGRDAGLLHARYGCLDVVERWRDDPSAARSHSAARRR